MVPLLYPWTVIFCTILKCEINKQKDYSFTLLAKTVKIKGNNLSRKYLLGGGGMGEEQPFYFYLFFNVGPPKEDIFPGHLLSPIFQSIIIHKLQLQISFDHLKAIVANS